MSPIVLMMMVMGVLLVRASSHRFGLGRWLRGHRHRFVSSRHDAHNHAHDCDHRGEEKWLKEYGGPHENNGCACLLFAEKELVFFRKDTSWYSCNHYGLLKCGEYCDILLKDKNMRYRSRQNACDTLGKEVNIPWYRRHQVCGSYGRYEDHRMTEDLCCGRGRPWDHCE